MIGLISFIFELSGGAFAPLPALLFIFLLLA
jgi:hypothetical protein